MAILIISDNRQAYFNYSVLETFEAGLVLTGSEVKSIRAKQVSLKDAYVSFSGSEAFLQKAHIAEYKQSSYNNHEPERLRKILLHRIELDRLQGDIQEKGLTLVPLKIYFKDGTVKVELGLCKGKKTHDKRESIKKKDIESRLRQVMRKSR